jgi:hypothetical protein
VRKSRSSSRRLTFKKSPADWTRFAAETELFDRIWYHRSIQHDYRAERDGDAEELERHQAIAGPARARVEATYTKPGQLGPYTDFEIGMLNGKMSALRWVLGSEWDFLDT